MFQGFEACLKQVLLRNMFFKYCHNIIAHWDITVSQMSCFYSAIKSFGRGPNTAEKKVAPDQTKEVRDVTTLIPSLQNPFINEEFYIKLM